MLAKLAEARMVKIHGQKRRIGRAKTLGTSTTWQQLRVLLIKILMTGMFLCIRRMMRWMLLMQQIMLLVQQ